jgi:branched-chain amino acid transport system permease protein
MTTFIQYLIDALNLASMDALIALGIAVVFGVMGLVNFAHGEIIMLGAYAFYVLLPLSFPVAVVGALVVAGIVALAMERAAFRPVRDSDPTTLLVTSFAVSFLLQSIVISTVGNLPKTPKLPDFLSASFEVGGLVIQWLQVITTVTTVVLVAGLVVFFKRSTVGREMRAAAEDFRMARILGVRANRVIAAAFGISGVLAGTAAILLVAQSGNVTSTIGSYPVVVAFIATILGGMGSLRGAVLGGLLLGIVTVALQAYLPLEFRAYRDAFAYSAVILVLLLRPQGLIVARSAQTRI